MKKLYVGCALTHAPTQFRQSIDGLKDVLRKDYEVLDFVGLVNGTDQEVYRHDTACVRECDVFVAICDYPAIGLGFELGLAVEIGKQILVFAHTNKTVTRLVRGIDAPNFSFFRYSSFSEIPETIKGKISSST